MRTLTAGIIGCGLIALHKYIPGFRKAKVKISAICDLNEALARKVAERNKIPRFYNDAERMIRDNQLDLVCICTPPFTHMKLGMLALKNNLHLLIEKPMAMTVKECDDLMNEAEKRNKKICVGHSDLFYPPVLKAKELVKKGYLGEFRGMRIFLSTPIDYLLSKRKHWVHELPGSFLYETCPHAVYLTLAFIKNIEEIKSATKNNLKYDWENYDDMRIVLKGENGISSIVITHSTNLWDAKVDIFGSDRNLYLDLHEFSVQEHTRDSLNRFSVGTSAAIKHITALCNLSDRFISKISNTVSYGHGRMIKEFVTSILYDRASPVSGQEGKETVRILNMIEKDLGCSHLGKLRYTGNNSPVAVERA